MTNTMIKKQNFFLDPSFQTNYLCFLSKIYIGNIYTLIYVYSKPSVSRGSINQALKKRKNDNNKNQFIGLLQTTLANTKTW